MNIYQNICKSIKEGRKQLAILVDPDKSGSESAASLAKECHNLNVDYIFVGSSLLVNGDIENCIKTIRNNCKIPIVIFPGNNLQITPSADAILFLSLISGRNPDMLIGNHVIAAPKIKNAGLEVISTGYMLIDCGQITSVHYISNTLPIPAKKTDIAVCTAMAGEMLGLKSIYLEGGSGADKPIQPEMINKISSNTNIPLITGGGIRTTIEASELWEAGADLLVVGNALENKPGFIKDLVGTRNKLSKQYG